MGSGQLDSQTANDLDTLQRLHERRGADTHRPLAQPVKLGLTAAFGEHQQVVQTLSLHICHVARQQAP